MSKVERALQAIRATSRPGSPTRQAAELALAELAALRERAERAEHLAEMRLGLLDIEAAKVRAVEDALGGVGEAETLDGAVRGVVAQVDGLCLLLGASDERAVVAEAALAAALDERDTARAEVVALRERVAALLSRLDDLTEAAWDAHQYIHGPVGDRLYRALATEADHD